MGHKWQYDRLSTKASALTPDESITTYYSGRPALEGVAGSNAWL